MGRPLEAAVEHPVDPAALAAVALAWEALQAPARGLIRPDAARRIGDREEAVGRALAAALASSGTPWARLWQRLGEAWSQGQNVNLIIDASEPEHRDLPWELLAESPEGPILTRTRRDLRISRLGPGQAAPRVGERLRLILWALDPEDPAVAQGIRRRQDLAARLGLELIRVEPPDLAPPPPAPGALDLLHVLAHGRRGAEQLEVLGRAGPLPPGAPVHALLPALGQCAAVILEVCEAAAPLPSAWGDLAGRCTHAGAPAVLAPRRPALVETLDALVEGLLTALLEGMPWSAAVGRGHEVVAQRATALPDARWWTLLEHRAGLADGEPLVLERGPLLGLDRLDPQVAEVLRAAVAVAEEGGRGFVGVEHLALAAAATPRLAGRSGALWGALIGLEQTLQVQNQAYTAGRPTPLRATPRLMSLRRALTPDTDLDGLWRLATACGGPLDGLGALAWSAPAEGQTVGSTVGGAPPRGPRSSAPPLHLEVVGGPEDGRRITLAEGQTLGRWDPTGERQADVALFEGGGAADLQVSRGAHARWLGPGRIELSRGVIRERRGAEERLPRGELALQEGDLLRLGKHPGVALRAVEGP